MLFTDGFARDPSALILNIRDAQSRRTPECMLSS